jgi:hypothetical protein
VLKNHTLNKTVAINYSTDKRQESTKDSEKLFEYKKILRRAIL